MMVNAVDDYRQYRVPTANNTALVDPTADNIEGLLRTPRNLNLASRLEFCGKPLDLVRRQAREEAVSLALKHTRCYGNPEDISASEIVSRPIVLSGHQPELFHAGVWFKNFLLARLGNSCNAICINFLVDNDLCRSTAIRVPSLNSSRTLVASSMAFDVGRDSIPWELRGPNSIETWEQFPAAVCKQLPKLLGHSSCPVVSEMWPKASESLHRTGRLGLALAEGRHRIEIESGIKNLEVPLSSLVSTRAFARFSIQLLAELPRFQDAYNAQRQRYRAAHRIRNSAHPVPPLEEEHGWIEAPWWVYRSEAPHRKRLWVRLLDDQLILSDRAGWQETIEGRLDCDSAATQWLDLLAQGVCIRPRALLTTMYLRLIVSDLFVHGIGGGKYDQLTNDISREFFGVEPPPMAVATSTLHLPFADDGAIDDAASIEANIRSERERIWRLKYHAEVLSESSDEEALNLSNRKRELLENIPPRGEKWSWHHEMTAINKRLGELSNQQIVSAMKDIESLSGEARENRVRNSREYSFCLYPREFIVHHLMQLAGI